MSETRTSKTSKARCAWCAGSGSWNVAPGNRTKCIVCGGSGLVSVTGTPVQCAQCRGTGKSNAAAPCLTCAGTGWEKVVGQ